MLSRWIYILIGNNNTGKTSFQRRLVDYLTGLKYQRLASNSIFEITHAYAPKKLGNIFVMSRSFQEKRDEYESVEDYFERFFHEEDICILSSHAAASDVDDIEKMIAEGKKRKYNVGGVFFSNADSSVSSGIALFHWDERFHLDNPPAEDEEVWKSQLDRLAWEFAEMLIRRAAHQ